MILLGCVFFSLRLALSPPLFSSLSLPRSTTFGVDCALASHTSHNKLSQVSANVFDKKDKASKKVQANFSEFWFKFVDTAPEVPPPAHL